MTTPLKLSEKQRLASELYGLFFFDISFRSRCITLVTAVEALLDPAVRSDETQSFVDDVKILISGLSTDDGTKQSLTSSVERFKYDSIGQPGRALVASLLEYREYGGLKAGKE